MEITAAQTVLTLTYQTGLLSFNEAMIKKLVEDKKLTTSRRNIGAQQVDVFSNEKFIFALLPQNVLQFKITGRCSLDNILNDIQDILTSLNYNLSSDVRLGFQCETRAKVDDSEYKKLTKELCTINYTKLEEMVDTDTTIINGLKILSHSTTSNIELILEPVPNTRVYNVALGCLFTKQNEYTTFITNFNENYMESLINDILN